MELSEIIVHKIQENGPISFCDFMEMALYYPGLGYYTSNGNPIGVKGDYYTSPQLTPVFGMIIGKQLEAMWIAMGKEPFTVVEFGGGNGKLCMDIMAYLKTVPEFYEKLNYCIIEKQTLNWELPEKVSWHPTLAGIPEITGCILSNELVDNFPVHQVVMEDGLMEVFIGHGENFYEQLQPASEELKAYFNELNIDLPQGFRTEINLQAIQWISEIAKNLKKGYVLTIDYGYISSQLYTAQKQRGTLLCYNKHTTNENWYDNIGNQDITAHINFSALCHWGFKNGLTCVGLTSQADFLMRLGFKESLREMSSTKTDVLEAIREEVFLSYMLLLDMGTKFKVLIQEKGMAGKRLMAA
ncbi:SAM-dependent methyltransferase [Flavobacterium amniphilum]|uniref:class I SAM-dependent methyltransferase n=1 Tax=Flavobacterium amniphilum TaxID=1834035 RepID=UPI002029FD51|nr:SAM-dependent methyltransferase [Flavobacterium amniphilum]MCL9807034.1 SAM-dependent methyltransferase [Flavobacterium amniphilum]